MAEGLVVWGVASRPYPGEVQNGDAHLVDPDDAAVLVAVVDGLGHGAEAAEAAEAALGAIRGGAGRGLPELMRAAHKAMSGTRGAAVTLGRFTPAGVELLAVGNVAGVVARRGGEQRRVPLRGGIVGFRLPTLGQVDRMALGPGDHVLLASDGIRSGFARDIDLGRSPQEIADGILARCARDTDDATVWVGRFQGDG